MSEAPAWRSVVEDTPSTIEDAGVTADRGLPFLSVLKLLAAMRGASAALWVIFLAVATRADYWLGTGARASMGYLIEVTGFNRRTVQRGLHDLIARKVLIYQYHGKGRRWASIYAIPADLLSKRGGGDAALSLLKGRQAGRKKAVAQSGKGGDLTAPSSQSPPLSSASPPAPGAPGTGRPACNACGGTGTRPNPYNDGKPFKCSACNNKRAVHG
jgi:hypothetical protein